MTRVVRIATSQPLVFDAYDDNRTTGSFVLIDAATHFTAGAGLIVGRDDELGAAVTHSASARIATAARVASSEHEATAAVERLLEEILS